MEQNKSENNSNKKQQKVRTNESQQTDNLQGNCEAEKKLRKNIIAFNEMIKGNSGTAK